MGNLLNELKNNNPPQRPRIAEIMDEMSNEDRADLMEALNDPKITGRAIAQVLKARGFSIHESSVYRYRMGIHVTGR